MNDQSRVSEKFLELLQLEGISLASEGVSDIALFPAIALQAIQLLRCSQTGIIGGEVWKCNSEGRFVPTYDIWDLDKSDYKSVDEYLLQSSDIAEKQVRGYLGSTDIVIVLGI